MMIVIYTFIYLISLLMDVSSYQGASNRLTRHLLNQHERSAPPDGKVFVSHEMELVHIITIDELKQTMRILVYVVEEWMDATLSWDPESFSGTKATWIPEYSIWVPDIIVFNMLDHNDLLQYVRSPVKVYHTGRVVYSYPAIYSVMCKIGIAKFPFDDQTCDVKIASWGYGEEKVLLNASRKPILQHYSANQEWALQNVDIAQEHYEHEGTVVSQLRYVITISRKPFYYLVSLVLPSYIICMLSIAGLFARFSTRHERQERFTLGVTSILSMAVLSLVVTEKVPHSSEDVPLLIVYFHFNIVMVTIATVLTSTVMRVHTRGFASRLKPPSQWMAKCLLIRDHPAFRKDEQGNFIVKQHIHAEQWGEISRRMDYLLSFFFLVIVSTPTLYLFYMCASIDNVTPEKELIERARQEQHQRAFI